MYTFGLMLCTPSVYIVTLPRPSWAAACKGQLGVEIPSTRIAFVVIDERIQSIEAVETCVAPVPGSLIAPDYYAKNDFPYDIVPDD
jgi:hypothetical protein